MADDAVFGLDGTGLAGDVVEQGQGLVQLLPLRTVVGDATEDGLDGFAAGGGARFERPMRANLMRRGTR